MIMLVIPFLGPHESQHMWCGGQIPCGHRRHARDAAASEAPGSGLHQSILRLDLECAEQLLVVRNHSAIDTVCARWGDVADCIITVCYEQLQRRLPLIKTVKDTSGVVAATRFIS